MKRTILIATAICAVVLSSCKKENSTPLSSAVSASDVEDLYTETGLPVQKAITRTIDANIGGYLEALPKHYADHPKKKYPVIIFLHGQGEMGNGSWSSLQKVANNAIPKLIANKQFPANFKSPSGGTYQFVVLSPQFRGWPQPSDVKDMINYALKHYRVDPTRVYICGLSMGGGGDWDYSWTYGKQATAIVPISGASWPTPEKGAGIAADNLAVWAFHNNNDPVVPSWYSIDYVQYINQANPRKKAKLTLFQASGHDAWTKATDPHYRENGKNIYEWMLSFQKKSNK
jgi:predicted peptidase